MEEDKEFDSFSYDAEVVLNPDFYLHICIMQAINAPHRALQRGQAKDGLISLIVAVDQLEKIAKAAGKIKPEDFEKYKEEVKKFESQLNERDEFLKRAMIANYKLELLLKLIFERLPVKADLVI